MTERLYNLLPGIYRQGDQAGGEPLRALLAVLQRELDVLERDVEAAYDNWFVQTCDLWALPYLAELVGLPPMGRQARIFSTQRRQVANAIAYGRRKGTLGVLEHALRDVTGWHVCAVELERQLAATPRLSWPPAGAPAAPDMRDRSALARLGGAFARQGHGADVRALAPATPDGPGGPVRHNLGRVGLFVWRLRSYTMRRCPVVPARRPLPAPRDPALDGFPLYAVEPGGQAIPLFNQPAVLDDIAERVEARHVPLPLTRLELAADLLAYRARAAGRPEDAPPASAFYGPGRGLLVTLPGGPDGAPRPVPPLEVASVDLAALAPGALRALGERGVRVAIDPERGWLAVLQPHTPQAAVIVDYTYGFSAEIGGGPYHRRTPQEVPAGARLIVVAQGTRCASLGEALAAWEEHCRRCPPGVAPRALIRILDNGIYEEGGELRLALPPGAQLTIAADNGVRPAIGPGSRLVVSCDRAELLGGGEGAAVEAWAAGQADSRLLCLDGLRVDGGLSVEWSRAPEGATSRLGVLISHCTIAPGVALALSPHCARATLLQLERSLVGPLRAPPDLAGIVVGDSIVDGAPGEADLAAKGLAVASGDGAGGPPLALDRATILGGLEVGRLEARDSLVAGQVAAGAVGELAHSYLRLAGAAGRADAPRFSATRLGEPAYGQLHLACPAALRLGASDGGELGAFHDLHHPQAADNLAPALAEYLPLGLEAGIFYVT